MIAIAVFSLLNKNLGRVSHDAPASHVAVIMRYAATFLLAIYGGFFSGGYVTILTAAFVLLFGMTFLQAVATTKVINMFSSGVATLVFVWRGVVDLKLGIILGASNVSVRAAGRSHCFVPQHSLAAADLHCGRAGPRCAYALVVAVIGNKITLRSFSCGDCGQGPAGIGKFRPARVPGGTLLDELLIVGISLL
jgi:hypothetical protein